MFHFILLVKEEQREARFFVILFCTYEHATRCVVCDVHSFQISDTGYPVRYNFFFFLLFVQKLERSKKKRRRNEGKRGKHERRKTRGNESGRKAKRIETTVKRKQNVYLAFS